MPASGSVSGGTKGAVVMPRLQKTSEKQTGKQHKPSRTITVGRPRTRPIGKKTTMESPDKPADKPPKKRRKTIASPTEDISDPIGNIVFTSDIKKQCSFEGCAFSSVSNSELRQHESKSHPASRKCSFCDHVSPSLKELVIHVHRHHATENTLKCDQCGYRGVNEARLLAHQRLSHCFLTTQDKRHLECHEKNTAGAACGARFGFLSQLRNHLAETHGIRPATIMLTHGYKSIEAFSAWKQAYERASATRYRLVARPLKPGTTTTYVCCRSGHSGTGRLHLYENRGFRCTSTLRASATAAGRVRITLYPFHYRHDRDADGQSDGEEAGGQADSHGTDADEERRECEDPEEKEEGRTDGHGAEGDGEGRDGDDPEDEKEEVGTDRPGTGKDGERRDYDDPEDDEEEEAVLGAGDYDGEDEEDAVLKEEEEVVLGEEDYDGEEENLWADEEDADDGVNSEQSCAEDGAMDGSQNATKGAGKTANGTAAVPEATGEMAIILVPKTEAASPAPDSSGVRTAVSGSGAARQRQTRGSTVRRAPVRRLADTMLSELSDSSGSLPPQVRRQITARISEVRRLIQSAARARGRGR